MIVAWWKSARAYILLMLKGCELIKAVQRKKVVYYATKFT